MDTGITSDAYWRKSSQSMGNGNCVEAGSWMKSSFSAPNNGGCVEVTKLDGHKEGSEYVIGVRDSKDPGSAGLEFTPEEWRCFLAGVRDGEFDLDDDGALVRQ